MDLFTVEKINTNMEKYSTNKKDIDSILNKFDFEISDEKKENISVIKMLLLIVADSLKIIGDTINNISITIKNTALK